MLDENREAMIDALLERLRVLVDFQIAFFMLTVSGRTRTRTRTSTTTTTTWQASGSYSNANDSCQNGFN